MEMLRRMLYCPEFHIDTNLINARGKLEEMNFIENWAENEVILVHMSEDSFCEAQQGNHAARTKKALSYIFTMIDDDINENSSLYKQVAGIVFPNGVKDQNQSNDVKIICNASHYQALLITNDGGSKKQPGGILGNAKALQNIATIFSPMEAVSYIRKEIKKRDIHNQKVNKFTGTPTPKWHGCD